MNKVINLKENCNILIEMKHGIGDTVFILPMIEEKRKKYPGAEIDYIVNNRSNMEVLNHGNNTRGEYYIIGKNNNIIGNFKNLFHMYSKKYDLAILSTNVSNIKGKLFFSLVRCKNKIGEQYMKVDREEFFQKKHFVDRYMQIISNYLNVHNSKYRPILSLSNKEEKEIKDRFFKIDSKDYIGICIGKGLPTKYKGRNNYIKRWNEDKMVSFVRLCLDGKYKVILLGGRNEVDLLGKYREFLLNKNLVNMVGKTSLIESMWILKRCRVVVGIDTGLQHVADALGTKTVSIFGPTNPRACGAFSHKAQFIEKKLSCRYCYMKEYGFKCTNRLCMEKITAKEVYDKTVKIFKGERYD